MRYVIHAFIICSRLENLAVRILKGMPIVKSNTRIIFTCINKNDNFTKEAGYS